MRRLGMLSEEVTMKPTPDNLGVWVSPGRENGEVRELRGESM